jgi:hypothetical protein
MMRSINVWGYSAVFGTRCHDARLDPHGQSAFQPSPFLGIMPSGRLARRCNPAEDSMSTMKKLLSAAVISAALTLPALVTDAGAIESGTVYVLEPSGKMMQAKFKTGGMQAFMAKKPRQVSRRMLLVMMDGKFYMIADPKGSLYNEWLDMRDAISH